MIREIVDREYLMAFVWKRRGGPAAPLQHTRRSAAPDESSARCADRPSLIELEVSRAARVCFPRHSHPRNTIVELDRVLSNH
jgi:hypothetical protein